jgi:hypothetical protein
VWFGERASSIVVSLPKENLQALEQLAQSLKVPTRILGHVIPAKLIFKNRGFGGEIAVSEGHDLWYHAFDRYMAGGDFLKTDGRR